MRLLRPPPSHERCPPSWLAETTAARWYAQSPPWPHSSACADGVMLQAPRDLEQHLRAVVEARDAAAAAAGEGAAVSVPERWTGCCRLCRDFCRYTRTLGHRCQGGGGTFQCAEGLVREGRPVKDSLGGMGVTCRQVFCSRCPRIICQQRWRFLRENAVILHEKGGKVCE